MFIFAISKRRLWPQESSYLSDVALFVGWLVGALSLQEELSLDDEQRQSNNCGTTSFTTGMPLHFCSFCSLSLPRISKYSSQCSANELGISVQMLCKIYNVLLARRSVNRIHWAPNLRDRCDCSRNCRYAHIMI